MTAPIIYAEFGELDGHSGVGCEGELVEHCQWQSRHFGGEFHRSTGKRYPAGRFPTPEIESG
jgi:hypothetical protein